MTESITFSTIKLDKYRPVKGLQGGFCDEHKWTQASVHASRRVIFLHPHHVWVQKVQMNLSTAGRGLSVPSTQAVFIEWQSAIQVSVTCQKQPLRRPFKRRQNYFNVTKTSVVIELMLSVAVQLLCLMQRIQLITQEKQNLWQPHIFFLGPSFYLNHRLRSLFENNTGRERVIRTPVNSKFHLIRSFFEIFARFLSFHF